MLQLRGTPGAGAVKAVALGQGLLPLLDGRQGAAAKVVDADLLALVGRGRGSRWGGGEQVRVAAGSGAAAEVIDAPSRHGKGGCGRTWPGGRRGLKQRLHWDPGAPCPIPTYLANVTRCSHHHAVLHREVDGVAAARVVEERKVEPQPQMALLSSQGLLGFSGPPPAPHCMQPPNTRLKHLLDCR